MTVALVQYSDAWPALFLEEAGRLRVALAPWLVGPVEHIGSTAIEGLVAKPIVDMLGPVSDLEAARMGIPILAALGYRHADHRPQEALWFYKQTDDDYGTRTHQLHLTRTDSALWKERLAFRDALRTDLRLLREYQDLKRGLAKERDLAAYTAGKRDFVARVLTRAGLELRGGAAP